MMNTPPTMRAMPALNDAASDWLASADAGSAAWWDRARAQGTPLMLETDVDGELLPTARALFLWQQPTDATAPAVVLIDVDGHTDHPMQQFTPMAQLTGTDVWHVSITLPSDTLCSYVFVPVGAADWPAPTEPKARRTWWCRMLEVHGQTDALSPWPALGTGWGQPRATLRVGRWAALERQRQTQAGPSGKGRQWTWHSARLSRSRRVWLHVPPAATGDGDPAERPWVLLLDGQTWAAHQRLFADLDQATWQGQIPAACYLAVDACDAPTRHAEMGCRPAFWEALHEELLPQALIGAGVMGQRPAMLVAGQSLGGLAALYAALQWPQRYGAVISQSGAFWWPELDAQAADHAWLLQRVSAGWRAGQAQPCLLQYGQKDPEDMRQLSRDMARALAANGQRVRVQEFVGGHDWLCWHEALLDGLASMLPALDRRRAVAAATNQNTVNKTTSFGRPHESESRYRHQPLR